jgi:hypothetical protein
MTSATAPFGIFQDLFAPLPETQLAREKDPIDRISDYADSSEGTWDVFRVIDLALSYVKFLPSVPAKTLELVEKVKSVASMAGMGLSIPRIIVNCNTLRHSIADLLGVQDLPYNDPFRTRKIAHAIKKFFVDSVDLTSTVAQAALFVDSAKVFIFEASHLRIIDGVYNVTSAISDGVELITECFKLSHYHSSEAQPRNQEEVNKLEERKRLSWMVIVKDIASVAGAGIALVGIVFGIAAQSIFVVSGAVLALSTIWLTMKLATYFYNKIIVEAPTSAQTRYIA